MDEKKISLIMEHWINKEFLMQESMDENIILSDSKKSVEPKDLISRSKLYKKDLPEGLTGYFKEKEAELAGKCREKYREKYGESDIKEGNPEYQEMGFEICISYGHLNRNIMTKYLKARYGWEKNTQEYFSDKEYIAFASDAYKYVYDPQHDSFECYPGVSGSPVIIAEEHLRNGGNISDFKSSLYNNYILNELPLSGDPGMHYEKFKVHIENLIKEMTPFLSGEEIKEFRKEAYCIYFKTAVYTEKPEMSRMMTDAAGTGLNSYYINDIEMIKHICEKRITVNTPGDMDFLRYFDNVPDPEITEKRVNISPRNTGEGAESLKELFRKYLDPAVAPEGKWAGGNNPFLMQQLSINLFRSNENRFFTTDGPPGTGKTTLLKEVIADVLTSKVLKMTELLEKYDYDMDLTIKKGSAELIEYGILIASGNNKAIENITKEFPYLLNKSPIYRAVMYENRGMKKYSLPLMATLGRKSNQKDYINNRYITMYTESDTAAGKELLRSECAKFIECHEKILKKKALLSERWNNGGWETLWKDYCGDKYTDAQKSNPCTDEEYSKLREELFCRAWKIHQLSAYSSMFLKNDISAVLDSLYENTEPDPRLGLSPVLYYNRLFYVSPVISSTYASMYRTFHNMSVPKSIGVLISDESGQVSPHCAAGALYRAQRALIVGDPKQIPPVVPPNELFAEWFTRPEGLQSETPYERGFVEGMPHEEEVPSLQQHADNCNPYGTLQDDTWVGCPLVLHSRCISPMFEISNRISYDSTMISLTKEPDEDKKKEFIFPESHWIQIKGKEGGGDRNHFVKRQAEAVLKMIIEKCIKMISLSNAGEIKEELNLFVITPFTSVSTGLVNYINYYIKERKGELVRDKKLSEQVNGILRYWLKGSNIGTVHTFQGKETDEVILFLGCTPESSGAAMWISKNIVNVAASRAKYRLYIVGDMDIWRKTVNGERTGHPVNNARRILKQLHKEPEGNSYKLGISDLNSSLKNTKPLGTRREKEEFICPECGSDVIYGNGGWFCKEHCGMQFTILVDTDDNDVADYNLDRNCIRKLLSGEPVLLNPFQRSRKTYIIKPGRYKAKDGNRYFDYKEGPDYAKKTQYHIPDEKDFRKSGNRFITPFLLCNCSKLVQQLRCSEDKWDLTIDYFDFILLDAVYTLYKTEKSWFQSLDILKLISGNPNPNPNTPVREEIDKRIVKMINNGLYSWEKPDKKRPLLPDVEARRKGENGRYKFFFREDIKPSLFTEYLEKEVPKGKERTILEIYIEFLNPVSSDGEKPVFPMTVKWLMIRFYILYRIAYMYRVQSSNRRISFTKVKKVLNLPPKKKRDEKDDNLKYINIEKERFYDKIKMFMDYLTHPYKGEDKDKKYVVKYDIKKCDKDSPEDAGYCGIEYIDINRGIWDMDIKSVKIEGTYETVFGLTIQVTTEEILNVGDTILGSDGVIYKIKQIIMPTVPGDGTIGLVVEKEEEKE